MKADDVLAISDTVENDELAQSLKNVAELLKEREQCNSEKTYQDLVDSFTNLSEDITALAFINSENIHGVNQRICLYIQTVICKLLENLPHETRTSILKGVAGVEKSDFSYIG